jgi:hypothetical protein
LFGQDDASSGSQLRKQDKKEVEWEKDGPFECLANIEDSSSHNLI